MSAGPDALVSAATQLRFDYVGLLRSGAPEVHRVTDKMPFNFFWAGLVHVLFPNATLLHSRRSAVDTCLSIYTTLAGNPWGFGGSQQDLVWYYQQYERLMAHWRKVIPSNRLFDVDYETLVREPEASIRNIIAYCDLEWNDACLRPESNRDSILTASQWQARQPIYQSSLGRAQNYEPWLSELKALVRDVSSQVSAPQIQSIHSGV
jgi:hypothetical protein